MTTTPAPGYAKGIAPIITDALTATATMPAQPMPPDQQAEFPQPPRATTVGPSAEDAAAAPVHAVDARPQQRPRRPKPVAQAAPVDRRLPSAVIAWLSAITVIAAFALLFGAGALFVAALRSTP